MNTNTKTNTSKGKNVNKGKGRISESRASTEATNDDLPEVQGAPVTGTRELLLSVMQQNVDHFKAKAASAVPGARDMPEKTAGQWVRLRSTINAGFADNFDALVSKGVITQQQHAAALASLRDSDGSPAPIYGAQKLCDTIALLSSGNLDHVSKLHKAYCATLCEKPIGSDIANDALAQGIARRAVCSVTGTAPTQRSSSNYALQSLGIIEATRTGAKMIDNAASRALRAVFVPVA